MESLKCLLTLARCPPPSVHSLVFVRTFSLTSQAAARRPPKEEFNNNIRRTRKKTADPFDRFACRTAPHHIYKQQQQRFKRPSFIWVKTLEVDAKERRAVQRARWPHGLDPTGVLAYILAYSQAGQFNMDVCMYTFLIHLFRSRRAKTGLCGPWNETIRVRCRHGARANRAQFGELRCNSII